MNVEIKAESALFPEKEYISRIYVSVCVGDFPTAERQCKVPMYAARLSRTAVNPLLVKCKKNMANNSCPFYENLKNLCGVSHSSK
jgi:hypothetical protein